MATESDAEAIKEKDHMSDIREEQQQLRHSVSFARYDIQRGLCDLVSENKTCDNLVSALEEQGGIDDQTPRATQKESNSQELQQQRGDTALSQHAVIINDKTDHYSSQTNVEAIVYMLNKREPNPARSITLIAGCIQELINEFLPIQEKLKILNPVWFIRHDIDQICSCLQNLSPISAHMSRILHDRNEISSTTLINKNISACSLAPYLSPNRNQSRNTFIQKRPIESPLKVEFPILPPEYMLDLLSGSSLYLKVYLDEQDHPNAIQGRDSPYSTPSQKGNSKNRRQVELQQIEIMNVNIMRISKFVSRKLFLFLPKKKLNWMIFSRASII